MATLLFNFVPFSAASNDQLAGELNAYKLILQENYLRNKQEDTHTDA